MAVSRMCVKNVVAAIAYYPLWGTPDHQNSIAQRVSLARIQSIAQNPPHIAPVDSQNFVFLFGQVHLRRSFGCVRLPVFVIVIVLPSKVISLVKERNC